LADFVAAVNQGTTSTRCMILDRDGAEVGRHQLEHKQLLPQAGLAAEIAGSTRQ
jgi:glycerol kinase